MVNKSCPEEMGNRAEKAFQDGVGIIYSLGRDVMLRYGAKKDKGW